MERPSSSNRAGAAAAACRAEQLYVTHCLRGDSVLGQEGFGVRASSSTDPVVLQFALGLPDHVLPSTAEGPALSPGQAPRRLARIEMPDGRIALIHSVYLGHDTRGRTGSYFTHALVYDRLAPLDALRAWAAPQWRAAYPAGAPRDLPAFDGVPVGAVLSDSLLTAFLEPAATARRRDWLRLLLVACRRILRATEEERGYLFLRAEPHVVAMLLYGVVRLLPDAQIGRLTFSTYECPGESLREQRHARILGAWTASGPSWPNIEQLQRRGYPLDLETEPSASELWGEISPGIDRLVDLAARGEWAAIEDVHALWQRGETAVSDDFAGAALVQPVVRRLHASTATAEDVAALLGHRIGREWLREMEPSAADARLAPLFPAGKRKSIERFALLQNAGLALEPAVLDRLLLRAQADDEQWLQYWLKPDNLEWLGRALAPESALTLRLWTVYARSIHKALLLGDRKQAALMDRLQAAHAALGECVPAAAAETLNDWELLRRQLHDPPEPDEHHVAALAAAAQRRGVKSPAGLLKKVFTPSLAGPAPASDDELRRIVRGVAGFHGPSVEKAFPVLLALVAECPGPLRAAHQRFFLNCAAPDEAPALVEQYRARLLLDEEDIEGLLTLQRWRGRRRWIAVLLGVALLGGLIGATLRLALR
jgi:hypothetical protein